MTSRILTTILPILAFSVSAHAEIIAQYAFPASGSLIPTSVHTNINASGINFTGSSATQFAISDDILAVNAGGTAASASTAFTANSYFQFTVTPQATFEMDLSSLSFDASYGPSAGAGYAIRSSLDNYLTELQSGQVTRQYDSFDTYSLDLSAASFQNITEDATFRIYIFLNPGGGNPALAIDNVRLDGIVATASAIPEPASAAVLVGFFAIGFATSRRRRT